MCFLIGLKISLEGEKTRIFILQEWTEPGYVKERRPYCFRYVMLEKAMFSYEFDPNLAKEIAGKMVSGKPWLAKSIILKLP